MPLPFERSANVDSYRKVFSGLKALWDSQFSKKIAEDLNFISKNAKHLRSATEEEMKNIFTFL